MSDRYLQFTSSPLGRQISKRLGLPQPTPLRRHRPGDPVVSGPVLTGAAAGSRLGASVAATLKDVHAQVHDVRTDGARYAGLVFDASGVHSSTDLRQVYEFFASTIRQVDRCGRVVVLAAPPEEAADPREQVARRALEGFTRSVGKELKRGATVQLVYVSEGAEGALDSTLRFLLSAKSAYVSGQVVRIGPAEVPEVDQAQPLRDKVALVTGASRGIGEAIAETLARDGAHVVCLDVPAQGGDLTRVANSIGGSTLQLDITAQDAPQRILEHFTERHGGIDVVVHNAGITRDKTLGRMTEQQWDAVIAVNLTSQERINEALLAEGSPLRPGGRIIGVASISGIAGNVGQTNYATSKAGVIGLVQGTAPVAAARGATVNAVAPGFIETKMTAAVPLFVREAGRRMNSMSQGGLPVDVAETIAWFAGPASAGVNGNVVRVCGQSLLGA
ncbi:3-oxoacyl-[acyl-carrier protein] reductase [Saccharopolyspora erythraea NRRL 2338]|uniref:3-ketoacyl-(Acyl-carrier-protein) reductase n=2 Tax=Saccharopolyspora erythraea TaxID=1836 RepID=A4FQY6_SACEN|nr:3-oxoacyl-ACP reductase [Saccharopolyspora erythraea]EQD82158.1 3-ketoacyl-ACP reductase [Saccharopolyspora erythraea D]PFG93063.1 3-oxoacyl-[acyl-carrier protein] reductase [Saccharopolyspora erythraea NRRL 2338]QRK89938.1 3-oxoacyl-ACP reductase [Saccharopolyspora erythraea]CAM06461.1 3-ketoacyl-(acyl-carrier-protein) reductase [Saccharopolyspora erythraea NRRL 2338]